MEYFNESLSNVNLEPSRSKTNNPNPALIKKPSDNKSIQVESNDFDDINNDDDDDSEKTVQWSHYESQSTMNPTMNIPI